MILQKFRLLSFVMALMIPSMMAGAFSAQKTFATSGETMPGYKLVNTYDSEKGIITSEIYLIDGVGLVGQLGLCYDTELVTLAIPLSDGRIITEYEEQMAKGQLKITHFVTACNNCQITSETNPLSELINEEAGEFFFAWYAPGSDKFDASETDKGICSVTFKVNDDVTKEDLEKGCGELISFASHAPSDPDIIGYNSGAYCANENTTALRNGDKARKRITLFTEYQGLDIAGGFDVGLVDTDDIKIIDRNTTVRIIVAPMGVKSTDIDSMFTSSAGMSINLCDKHDNLAPDSITTGCYVKITKGNLAENIIIAVEKDIDCDGRVSMSDLNALMRIMAGTLENASIAVPYTYDTDGDKQLSREEYLELINAITEK